MNDKKTPFEVSKVTWGKLKITVDKIDNIRYSAKNWYCDAFTLSEEYDSNGYGQKGKYKVIGGSGTFKWRFADPNKTHDENLLPEQKKQHDKGLTYQKAGKEYKCFYCKKTITKGQEYERYKMRYAGSHNMPINEVFCLGHRDKMREKYFKKPVDQIKYSELMEVWDKKKII